MPLSPYFIVMPVGGMLVAAASSAPPDLIGIAAIITAAVGVVGFFATLYRGRANNKRVEEVEQAASYVKGFDALIARQQKEIETLQHEMTESRNIWAREKTELLTTVLDLREQLQKSIASNSVTRSELTELRGQIKGFLTSAQYEEFQKHF